MASSSLRTTTAALVLDEVEELDPRPGQVRIAVSGGGTQLKRYRHVPRYLSDHKPAAALPLGMEVAGRVDRTAPGLEKWLGRRVVAVPDAGHGGYAEQAVAIGEMVFDAPEQLDDIGAAAF